MGLGLVGSLVAIEIGSSPYPSPTARNPPQACAASTRGESEGMGRNKPGNTCERSKCNYMYFYETAFCCSLDFASGRSRGIFPRAWLLVGSQPLR